MKRAAWAVVVAAGRGQRFGTTLPKQYQPLGGHSVLECSLRVFAEHPGIAGIVLVLGADDTHWPSLEFTCAKPLHVVTGGAERADSVVAGLRRLLQLDAQAWALVHDAARACLTAVLVSRLIDALADDEVGGLLAMPAHDTLKQVDGERVSATLDRSCIWQAQTPQMFPAAALLEACTRAQAADLQPTDEAAAMEAAGLKPKVVPGAAHNFKITTPEDLERAQLWWSQRR